MCAPKLGIEEDPATGSACAALVGSVAKRFGGDGQFRLSIVQGEKMGRRSEIFATAVKSGNEVETIMITGYAAFVAEGALDVPAVWLK